VPTPTPPKPPTHRELTDADCLASDTIADGVYTLKNTVQPTLCLGFDAGDPTKVKLFRCDQAQERLFTVGRRKNNGCYFVRNGNVHGYQSGWCLDSDRRNSGDELKVAACDGTRWQAWKLFKLPNGTYNLINKQTGECLDRDSNHSGSGDDAHQYICNASERESWYIEYVRLH
jgi:hypothetical protein